MTNVAATPVEPSSEAVNLIPVTTAPMADAVVTVCKSPVGAHVGISYRVNDAGARRHLHLAFHFRLKDDEAPDADALWVAPRLDEIALADVRASAHLIARRHKNGRVPYAFRSGAAFSATTGALELNGSLRLTCATLGRPRLRARPRLVAGLGDVGRGSVTRAAGGRRGGAAIPCGAPANDARCGGARGSGGERSPLLEDPRGRGRRCLGDDRAPSHLCAMLEDAAPGLHVGVTVPLAPLGGVLVVKGLAERNKDNAAIQQTAEQAPREVLEKAVAWLRTRDRCSAEWLTSVVQQARARANAAGQ